jgi:hypothetical protein
LHFASPTGGAHVPRDFGADRHRPRGTVGGMVRCLVLLVMIAAACGGSPTGECLDGESRACYRGPPGTEGVGICEAGLETCTAGTWSGYCVGDVVPRVERCDGVDEDCSGVIDDVAGTGSTCTANDGCEGSTACAGDRVTCISPGKNACGLCDGPELDELGEPCSVDDCGGVQVCNAVGDATQCSAQPQNACGLCGGPTIVGLGTTCMGAGGCAGTLGCNTAGTATVCDCSANLCDDLGTLRPIRTPAVGALVITEVMPNPAAVADNVGEWFEARALAEFDLNNLALDRAGDAIAPEPIVAFECLAVTAGQTLVFARNADPAVNGGIPPPIAHTFGFTLIDGTPVTPGDVRVLAGATVIDAITWTSTRSGRSHQLDPASIDAVANDNEAAFCDGSTPYGAGDLGTPNAANLPCPVVAPPGSCLDGGTPRPIVKPAPGALVITEVMVNPIVEPAQEWFEITNVGAVPFDLNELGLDRAGDARAPDLIVAQACRSLAPGGFAVFGRSADPAQNGGITVDATFGFALPNTNADVQVVDGAVVLDQVTWGNVSTATFDGRSLQLDPDHTSVTGNDVPASTINTGVWCLGQTTYGDGTNRGTPGAANAECP